PRGCLVRDAVGDGSQHLRPRRPPVARRRRRTRERTPPTCYVIWTVMAPASDGIVAPRTRSASTYIPRCARRTTTVAGGSALRPTNARRPRGARPVGR